MTERVRALSIRAKEFKSLREVEIGFDGEFTEIRGDSGQGKTAILHAIEAAIQGAEPSMIRNGEDSAELVLDLSDVTIRRIMHRDFDDVIAINDKTTGKPMPKTRVKGFLRALIGSGAVLRPLEWAQLGAGGSRGMTGRLREQRDALLSAVPVALSAKEVAENVNTLGMAEELSRINLGMVDHSEHGLIVAETFKNACYEHRKKLNEIARAEEGALEASPKPEPPPPDCPVEELKARAEAAAQALYGADALELTMRQQRDRAERLRNEIAEKQEELASIEAELETDAPDRDVLRSDLDRAQSDLAARESQDRHDIAATRLTAVREEARRYDTLVELFRDDIPARLLARMEMPVEGLGVEDGVVTLNGVPLHQLGTSEQIRVGVQVAARLNPGIGFVLIDGAESMGRNDRRALAAAAAAEGVHLIMTFVDADAKPQPGVIVMEDGEAKA